MRGLNKVTLIGNLGKDPDVQTLDGNVPVAKFSLATTEAFKDKTAKLNIVPIGTRWCYGVIWQS